MNGLIVKKYGGSSVATAEKLHAVGRQIVSARATGQQVVVVTSAMGDTTDDLIGLAQAVAPGIGLEQRREMDLLLATGEQATAALLAMAIREAGMPAVALTGTQAEILTDSSHGAALIRQVGNRRIRQAIQQGEIPVIAGFQGCTELQEVTTLGRGGSDTSAVALAVALKADVCEIYTDVDGIYSADPRQVPGAWLHERLTHREALLMALAGAAVLHSRAAALAGENSLALRVLNSRNENSSGTLIEGGSKMADPDLESARVLGIAAASAAKRLVLKAHHPNTTATVLRALAGDGIMVDLLEEYREGQGGRRLCVVVPAQRADQAQAAMARVLGDDIAVQQGLPIARLTVVGTRLSACTDQLASALQQLSEAGIDAEGTGFTELGLTLFLPPEHADEAARLLHSALLGDGAPGGEEATEADSFSSDRQESLRRPA